LEQLQPSVSGGWGFEGYFGRTLISAILSSQTDVVPNKKAGESKRPVDFEGNMEHLQDKADQKNIQ
jgi:hypothetical protein